MTLRFAYGLGLFAATTVALLAVLLGGEMPAPAWASLAAPPLSLVLHARQRALHGSVGTMVGAAASVLGILAVVERGAEALVVGAATALLGLLVGRLLTRETLAHDLQALLASLLLVLAGSVLHTQLTYGVVLAAYAVTSVWALVTRQLVAGAQRHAERTGTPVEATLGRRDVATATLAAVIAGLALVLLFSTTVLFVLFPRVGIGSFGFLGRRGVGFPPDVRLGGPARAAGGGEVAARVRDLPKGAFERGLYLRGAVYDRMTRSGFDRSTDAASLSVGALARDNVMRDLQYEVFMQPLLGEALLSLGPVHGAWVLAGGESNPSMHARIIGRVATSEFAAVTALSGPVRYAVRGDVVTAGSRPLTSGSSTEIPNGMRRYVLLPSDVDPRIASLAVELTASAGSFASRADAIRRHLARDFSYTLDNPNGGAPDPLASFLFADRRGHCEYFASAYAALLRAAGVPSRVVGGFMGGTWDDAGELVVFRSADAHAWVEWYEPGAGWVVDDATPALAEPFSCSALSRCFSGARRECASIRLRWRSSRWPSVAPASPCPGAVRCARPCSRCAPFLPSAT
jgi:protein-glutamine gamma-glutamyltransferase